MKNQELINYLKSAEYHANQALKHLMAIKADNVISLAITDILFIIGQLEGGIEVLEREEIGK